MPLPEDIRIAQQLEAAGFFTKVAAGDARAASYFVRLFAYTANPNGTPAGWGWLRKGGGHNVEGYAEDAVVYGSNPADLFNVADLVIGTGAPGATLNSTTTDAKPRRASDVWEAPKPLSAEQLSYLKGGTVPGPIPGPDPCAACKSELAALKASTVPKIGYPGDAVWDAFGAVYEADVKRAGQTLNAQSFRWAGRTIHDDYMEGLTLEASIAKHRAEWCAILGIPVE